jgi:hypothetical protein
MFATLVAAVLYLVAERETAVSVVVIPEADCISVYDPLLVKVVATNHTKIEFDFHAPLSVMMWGLEYEIRSPTAKTFRKVNLARISCPSFPVRGRGGFGPGASYVSYNYLFCERLRKESFPLFPEVGNWEIRARVVVGQQQYTSKPVVIKVLSNMSIPAAFAHVICVDELWHHVEFGGLFTRPNEFDTLAKFGAALLGTNAGATVQHAARIADVQFAKTDHERDAAIARLAEHRKTCHPVQQELLDLLLIDAHIKRREFATARRLLQKILDHTDIRVHLYGTLELAEQKKR